MIRKLFIYGALLALAVPFAGCADEDHGHRDRGDYGYNARQGGYYENGNYYPDRGRYDGRYDNGNYNDRDRDRDNDSD